MPYLPDLIPEKSKIIPEYFRQQELLKPKPKMTTAQILLVLLFTGAAIYLTGYLALAVLLGLLALANTGMGSRWLENKGKFEMTTAARLITSGVVIALCIPVYLSYVQHDAQLAAEREAAKQRAIQFSADSLKQDDLRKQHFFALIGQTKNMDPESALPVLQKAKNETKTAAEKDSVQTLYKQFKVSLIERGLASRKYRSALTMIQELISGYPHEPKLFYQRAECYIGMDSLQLAVNDLDTAKAGGYAPAGKLFERINPLKKHIVGYCTLCNDGSTSDATGRGACSWHGGVAQWDHPIYETSRKYGE